MANRGVITLLQVLCRALGGKTGRSKKGWDIGVNCIHPTAAMARLFSPIKLPVHMPIIEFHQDEVHFFAVSFSRFALIKASEMVNDLT